MIDIQITSIISVVLSSPFISTAGDSQNKDNQRQSLRTAAIQPGLSPQISMAPFPGLPVRSACSPERPADFRKQAEFFVVAGCKAAIDSAPLLVGIRLHRRQCGVLPEILSAGGA
jgi:hypothetical protein